MMIPAAVLLLAAATPAVAPVADVSEAYYRFSLAQQARLAGHGDQALQELRRAQKLHPQAAYIRVELARLLREAGRLPEALSEARAAALLEPKSADVHLMLAQLHQASAGGPDGAAALKRAAEAFEAALAADAANLYALQSLAQIYNSLQMHTEAARTWTRFLEVDPGNFEGWVQLGTHHLALGDTKAASDALDKAVALQPESERAYQALGDLYARAEMVDQAVLNYRKALEIEPGDVRLQLLLGEVLFKARRYQEAVAAAEAALAADRANAFALDLKGKSLRELRDYEGALRVANAMLALDADDLKAAYLRITVAEAKRDHAEAVRLLEAVLKRAHKGEDTADATSNDRVFLVHLAFALQQLGRHADAVQAFVRARALGPESDAALVTQLVEARVLARDLEAALADVREARKAFPADKDLVALEANVLREKGDVAAGEKLVAGLLEKSPKEADVLLGAADFYQRAHKLDQAERLLRQARELQPRDLRTLFQLGAVLERSKRPEAAEPVFREALEIQPDSAPILNYLGYMNVDRGVKLEESLQFIQRALEIDPDNGAYLDSLGWAFYRLDRLPQAEEMLRKAVERQQDDSAVVLDHLGDVLHRRGDVRGALEAWNRSLRAKDEAQELDRGNVERKVREAQARLEGRDAKR